MIEALKRIELLLLDVDGIMTDGRIIIDDHGAQTKAFDVKDGHGLKMLQRTGVKVGIITGRQSEVVIHRAKELGIEILYQGVKVKLEPYGEILSTLQLADDKVAYMGDDLVDLPLLRRVGFAATVADAVDEVKPHVDYITRRSGGRGAVREVCDLLMRAQGTWAEQTSRYFTS